MSAEAFGEPAAELDGIDDFDAVYEAHYQSVYRAVRAIVLDAALAEDVTQNTFIQAYRHRDSYRPVGSVGGWLHRIAVRQAISSLRWRRVQDRLLKAIRLRSRLSGSDWTLGVQLANLLEQLAPGTRAAVVLHYVHGYRYREIALMLDIPEGTVATRIANGLRAMRKHLDATEERRSGER